MARRLTGQNPLSYLGVDPVNPTQAVIDNRNPTVNDYDNFQLQCQWLNSITYQMWVLVNKADFVATWVQLGGGGGGGIQTITGDVGGAVPPDGAGNIDLQGGGPYVFTGNPGANLLTLDDDGTVGRTITGNVGGAISPTAGNWNIIGSGPITTTGAGSTLTIAVSGAVAVQINTDLLGPVIPVAGQINVFGGDNITTTGVGDTLSIDVTGTTDNAVLVGNAAGSIDSLPLGTDGQIIIAATGGTPLFADLTSLDMSVTITPGANSLDLSVAGAGPGVTQVDTDSGTAIPVAGVLEILGASNISTAGAGNTVSISVSGNTQYAPLIGAFDGSIDEVGPLSTGELIIGVTGTSPNVARLTAGSNITIDDLSVPGEITISSTGGGGGTGIEQIVGGGSGTLNFNAFASWAGIFSGSSSSQADMEYVMPVAGTFSKLYVDVGTNSATNTNSITFNKNGANTPLQVSYGAGVTGTFSDLVNTVSVSVGDTVQFEQTKATTADCEGIISLVFTADEGSGGVGDLVLLESTTVSGASSVIFTSGITNTYRNFLLQYDSVPAYSAVTKYLVTQISTNSGVSYITSGYIRVGGAATAGLDITQSTASAVDAIGYGSAEIFNVTSGAGYVSQSTGLSNILSSSTPSSTAFTSNGFYNTANVVADALRVVWDDGSTVTGTFSLYGYRQ